MLYSVERSTTAAELARLVCACEGWPLSWAPRLQGLKDAAAYDPAVGPQRHVKGEVFWLGEPLDEDQRVLEESCALVFIQWKASLAASNASML